MVGRGRFGVDGCKLSSDDQELPAYCDHRGFVRLLVSNQSELLTIPITKMVGIYFAYRFKNSACYIGHDFGEENAISFGKL